MSKPLVKSVSQDAWPPGADYLLGTPGGEVVSGPLEGSSLISPDSCVRCGSCMAVCPLYRVTGREGAVARGKLTLWELFQSGRLKSPEALRDFMEFCLLCGACTEKCAVGLDVPEMVKQARAEVRARLGDTFHPAWLLARASWQAPHLIPAAAPFAPLLNRLKDWLGKESGLVYRLWPGLSLSLNQFPNLNRKPFRQQAPSYLPGRGPLKIAFFSGCGLEALFPQAGLAFFSLCERLGIEVVFPPGQGCCGFLAESAGEAGLSRVQGKLLVQAFQGLPVDFVVTACASCSYRLKRLGQVLEREAEAEAAAHLAGKVLEATEFLVRIAHFQPSPRPCPEGVAYHDPCHLHRGQGIYAEPRKLLTAATGEAPREAGEVDCCGLGGIFGVVSPEVSRELGQARAGAYRATGAKVLATSCSGCLMQLHRVAEDIKVVHLLELLA